MIRVCHVLGALNRGGVETWLVQVLRNINRERFHMDFLVHTTEGGSYDDEVCKLGSRIIPCSKPQRAFAYARNLNRILREYGPYDVVHSHVHHFSGLVLRVARCAGVPVRIAHSHSDTSSVESRAGCLRRSYNWLMKTWVLMYATDGLAASEKAAVALWGRNWADDGRVRILHYGVDLTRFFQPIVGARVREALRLPVEARVVGHVGRFTEPKNHLFLLEVAQEVMRRRPDIVFLFVGDGPLRHLVEERIFRCSLQSRVILTGMRSDVAELMLGAMDLFCMPSLFEGLPVAAVEAQAAGLPCLISTDVTREVDIVPGAVKFLPRALGAEGWAREVCERLEFPRIAMTQARESIRRLGFDIETSVDNLQRIYEQGSSG